MWANVSLHVGRGLAYLIPRSPSLSHKCFTTLCVHMPSGSLRPWLPPLRQHELHSYDCDIPPLLYLHFQHPRCPRRRLHEANHFRHHQRNPCGRDIHPHHLRLDLAGCNTKYVKQLLMLSLILLVSLRQISNIHNLQQYNLHPLYDMPIHYIFIPCP